MLRNALMFMVYCLLIFYALFRIHCWLKNAFTMEESRRKKIALFIDIFFIIACSTIMIWLPFPRNAFSVALIRIGNYWLGFFIQFIALIAISDLLLLIIKFIRKRKNSAVLPQKFYRVYGKAVFVTAIVFTILGLFMAKQIRTREVTVTVSGKNTAVDELNVVLFADTHMGYSIGCEQIRRAVDQINAANPDVVLFAGDIFDNNYDSLEDPEALAAIYRDIKAPMGVYAVFGNHDVSATLVGGFTVGGSRLRDPRMMDFLKESNIHIMLDEIVTLADDSIYLVGRIDGEETGDGKERKALAELVQGLDPDKPLFVLNHEPVGFEEYTNLGVDILFSGHTHAGQTFPLHLIMPVAWKNAVGTIQVDGMYNVVTGGIGVYGPFMRLFCRPDIYAIHILFR